MQIQDRENNHQTPLQSESQLALRLSQSIASSQNYLLSRQYGDGFWWSELESNVTITAEAVLLHKIWRTDASRPLKKIEAYLRSQQREHGGWELFYGDGGEISTSVEAYMALKLLGVTADDSAMIRARDFILQHGGISKTRIFTKFHLALIGCYSWRGIPSLPPWVMLLPDNPWFSIYELSSWARSSTVPLLIVFDQKPVYVTNPGIILDELYTEGIENVKYELPKNHDWTDVFLGLDQVFKLTESLNLVPLRTVGIEAAEKWILERQEATGDWGGIIPAMLNSLLALRSLGYDVNDPIVQRGLTAIDNFAIETDETYCVQPCISPVWDTAWVMRSLVASGVPSDHPAIVKAGEWLLQKQILDYGDWAVKNRHGKPGAWAFEFENRFYPDVDDTAVVVMALDIAKLPNENLKAAAIQRALDWVASMQCEAGGWAAFDLNNNQDWLNLLPYSDLKAMIDPNTADVTARVIEMLGACHLSIPHPNFERALQYLLKEQEAEGCWYGRWGVNYIYGTSGVIAALALVNPHKHQANIQRGAAWLIQCQNPDGGWGETCLSYKDTSLKGKGNSTASQTAWAVLGLISASEVITENSIKIAIHQGINYLLDTQKEDGSWYESEFTGTGFPCHFYLKYHMYQQYFPLLALGRYTAVLQQI